MASDSDSEFGYDFSVEEEELLIQLASGKPPATTLPSKERPVGIVSDSGKAGVLVDQDEASNPTYSPPPGLDSREAGGVWEQNPPPQSNIPGPDQDVCYPDLSVHLSKIDSETRGLAEDGSEQGTTNSYDDPYDDGRSPLQRFRSSRPLTVTDLNAGAWCELQYWYTLTRLPGGRRTRTAAMRQGSKIHQKLEDEVHERKNVEIMTKEDGFALRLWNLVQGLRTLRDNGLTRELEVWGMIGNNIVNGIIDGVSYENPDSEFEEQLRQETDRDNRQKPLTDYFASSHPIQTSQKGPKIYLTDVKTRGSLAPVSKALLRPAKIQLLLYHRFLSDMAAGKLDFFKVFRQYRLDPDGTFSDTFIAQIGALHEEIFVDAPSSSGAGLLPVDSTQDSAPSASQTSTDTTEPDLLKYRSLRELLSLVHEELAATFPNGAQSMGNMLRVQYIHRDDGREIDTCDFPVSQQALENYLSSYMTWWRGERKAKGVEIEEAFKCRTCEFASDCTWRQSMDGARLRKAQQRVWAGRRVESD